MLTYFGIKFRFCEAFAVLNSVSRILLIETLHNLGLLSVPLPKDVKELRSLIFLLYPIPTYVSSRLVYIQMFYISHLAFLRFTFH